SILLAVVLCHFYLYDLPYSLCLFLLLFNSPPPTVFYTLSLHDALPILPSLANDVVLNQILRRPELQKDCIIRSAVVVVCIIQVVDRKSTRLNSSHGSISYAVFCLKKKKIKKCTKYLINRQSSK